MVFDQQRYDELMRETDRTINKYEREIDIRHDHTSMEAVKTYGVGGVDIGMYGKIVRDLENPQWSGMSSIVRMKDFVDRAKIIQLAETKIFDVFGEYVKELKRINEELFRELKRAKEIPRDEALARQRAEILTVVNRLVGQYNSFVRAGEKQKAIAANAQMQLVIRKATSVELQRDLEDHCRRQIIRPANKLGVEYDAEYAPDTSFDDVKEDAAR